MSIPNYPSFNTNAQMPNPFSTGPMLPGMQPPSGSFMGPPSGPLQPPMSGSFMQPPMSGSFTAPPMSGSFMPPTSGPLQGPPFGSFAGGGGSGEIVVEIKRLLDMPMQEKMFSNDLKQYRVRAFEDMDGEPNIQIAQTGELAGIAENFGPDGDQDTETVRLGGEGIMRMTTQSPVIHLLVEYAGGFLGNMKIGRCRIARNDQRSREIWPYALSSKSGQLVGCGIELKVAETGPPPMAGPPMSPSFNTMAPMGGTPPGSFRSMPGTMAPSPVGPSYQTIPPMGMPPPTGMMPPGTPPFPPPGSGPGGPPPFQTMGPSQMMSPRSQPSFHTVPPGMLQPQMFPNFNGMPPPGSMGGMVPQVKEATMGYKNVTSLMNQLIHANGVRDPTRGATLEQIFGSREEVKVWGPGVRQRETHGGGTFKKDFPINFAPGQGPPYDLSSLFVGELPPSQVLSTGLSPMRAPTAPAVVAIIELDKVIDIPMPAGGGKGEVVLSLERASGGKQLAQAGPYKTQVQGSLCKVENCRGKLAARVTMEDLAKGAVEFRVAAHYKAGGWFKWGGGDQQRIGVTAPFSVSWEPQPSQFVALMAEQHGGSFGGRSMPVGGVYISHRFAQDSKELYASGPVAPEEAKATGGRGEDDHIGATGKFKKGSQDETYEAAALAVEAQNRAVHQQINMAKSAKQIQAERESQKDSGPVWRTANAYRDWKDLDSVFITMGPNYVAQSSEVGTNVCRVYEDESSVMKEIMDGLGMDAPKTPEEKVKMSELIRSLYKGNPEELSVKLRPIICKDVKSINRDGVRDANIKPTLRVKVHSAMNLRVKEGFLKGSVHPKAVVEILGRPASKWESMPCQDGKHVVWNQEGVIKDYNYGDDLKITIVDKDFIGFDDHLGEARLPGSDFYPQSFFAQLPLYNGDKSMTNTSPAAGAAGASLLIEVKVIEPLGKADNWPPFPPLYAPLKDLNELDQEVQRLANWDIHQNAKLAFADVNPNYQMYEDVWGALHTQKSINEGNAAMRRPDWRPERVKDECLMA